MILLLNGFRDIMWIKGSQFRIPHRVAGKRHSDMIAAPIPRAKYQCGDHTHRREIPGQKVVQHDGWRQLWSICSALQHREAGTTIGIHVKATALAPWPFPAERAKRRID